MFGHMSFLRSYMLGAGQSKKIRSALKLKLQIENWSGKTVHSVYQDFHAKVGSKNLTCILAHQAQQEVLKQSANKKHDYQVNMSYAASSMKDTIVSLFKKSSIAPILEWLWIISRER